MSSRHPKRRVIIAAAILGVGLSGFFDGILLHQVLQWHHLLSLVPGATFRNMETQILADGLFHVLMYVVVATGLWLLWRTRPVLASDDGSWRTVGGGALLGFGIWNVVDVAFFHWVLGIHRIRINVPDPMAYDLGWLALFGLAPLALGWLLLRRTGHDGRGGGAAAAAALGLLALVAAPIASLPIRGTNTALVIFAPGTRPAVAFNAAIAAEAPILWIEPHGRMMAVALPNSSAPSRLYRAGALLVTRSPALAGCAAATTA